VWSLGGVEVGAAPCLPSSKQLFTIVNVSSPTDDRTARARIRDEALRLFGTHGPAAVTVRDIATAAEVSPALVVRHYESKDGLHAAVDEHVADTFAVILAELSASGDPDSPEQQAATLAGQVMAHLPADSAIPAYLGRMLLAGETAGTDLFGRLYTVSREALADLAAAGAAVTGDDPEVRAAFLLVNDLALLTLRPRIREVLGFDPLSAGGMRRWGNEVLAIYRTGLGGKGMERVS